MLLVIDFEERNLLWLNKLKYTRITLETELRKFQIV